MSGLRPLKELYHNKESIQIFLYRSLLLGCFIALIPPLFLFILSGNSFPLETIPLAFILGLCVEFLFVLRKLSKQGEINYEACDYRGVNLFSKKDIMLLAGFFVFFLVLTYGPPVVMNAMVESYEANGYFQNLSGSVFTDESDSVSKSKAILKWQEDNMRQHTTYNNSYQILFSNIHLIRRPKYEICLRITEKVDPRWTLISKGGACEENALAFAEFAQMAGIPVRVVYMNGEDHIFNQAFINESWITIDATRGEQGFNTPPDFYETAWGWNVSYAYAVHPNGTIEEVTQTYTDTANLTVTVVDENGNPVKAIKVSVYSNNREPHKYTNLTHSTNNRGACSLVVGGGNYTIEAQKESLYGEKTITIQEKNDKEIVITVEKDHLQWIYQRIPYTGVLAIIFAILAYMPVKLATIYLFS